MSLKKIRQHNTFHARIALSILYLEKWFQLHKMHIFVFAMKIIRKFIIQGLYCCEISPNSFVSLDAICTCRLPHPYLIIIHASAKIKEHSVIFHNTTIGVIENERSPKAALIGERVYIGTGASILGHIHIGNDVKIGAHALVLKNISDGQTVVGLHK